MAPFHLIYHLDVPSPTAAAWAEAVLVEQTVETPLSVARRDPFVARHMLGEVVDLQPCEEGGFLATLDVPPRAASADPAQFMNVVFGNVSLHTKVSLYDLQLPPSLSTLFNGPAFGLERLRRRLGVPDRPLTCAALKPVGLGPEALAARCRTFAEGGIDLIKDDHYLADHPFCPFETRVRACQAAVEAVAEQTGHRACYVPNLSGTPDQVRRQADYVQHLGVGAVMVAPMLLGLPTFHTLTHRHLSVPVLAHPSFGGATRIRPEVLFGKLFRLFGADAVIFTNYGGRFSYPRDRCLALADTLRAPWPPYRPAVPVPAGGMTVERVPELIDAFGPDTMLLIGGSLLEAGDDLLARTRAFTAAVHAA